ncbi:unnamed protein product [Amoebophrya sp. A25]|nr:unnamed protein product [Amoebophrya sp. A25]|eukprot:GSA25T00008564001.1
MVSLCRTVDVPQSMRPNVCWVCQRQFDTPEQLVRHEQLSKVHGKNMETNLYENIQKREEIRVTILETKSEMREIEMETANHVIIPKDKEQRLIQLERTMKSYEREYGQRQEQIEANRAWSATREVKIPKGDDPLDDDDDVDDIYNRTMNDDPNFPRQWPHLRFTESSIAQPAKSKSSVASGKVGETQVGGSSSSTSGSPAGSSLDFGLVKLQAACSTWTGGKDNQEDRFVFDKLLSGPRGERIMGYAVFDGHSGYLCAEFCEKKLMKILQEMLTSRGAAGRERLTEDFLKRCVLDAFAEADERFCDAARGRKDMDGTTAICCFLWEDLYGSSNSGNPVAPGIGLGAASKANAENAEHNGTGEHQQHETTASDIPFTNSSNLRLLVANLGDSRAVLVQKRDEILQRDSCYKKSSSEDVELFVPYGPVNAVRLSDDHKPDRPDEKRRIEAVGGVVQDMTGVARVFTPGPLNIGGRLVQWGLAVGRSFGDLPLKEPRVFGGQLDPAIRDLVSGVPEITTFKITPGRDLFLILACDGIWDVLKDEEAAVVAHGHYRAGLERVLKMQGPELMLAPSGVIRPAPRNPITQAARGLVRESFQRYSLDNLTALVVALLPTEEWWQKVGGIDVAGEHERAAKMQRTQV